MRYLQCVMVALIAALCLPELDCSDSFGEACLDNFTKGMPHFVLDLDESVKSGATFLSSPILKRGKECIRACCKTTGCNLALVQQGQEEEDIVTSCYLLNCVYEQEFVCKFVRKDGFLNYVTQEVYNKYVAQREHPHGADRPPIARAGPDVKVQPMQTVTLSGIESWDQEGIADYDWLLVEGDESVVLQKVTEDKPDALEVSNLHVGQYVFLLIVTDTAQQQSTATVTVTVLSKEETEEHCMAPKKVGRCRGSFRRWHFSADTSDCEEFTFGGCKANKNNYIRQEDCLQACSNIAVPAPLSGPRLPPVCNVPCLPTQFQCADGCCIPATSECDETADCSDQSDESSCDKYDHAFKELRTFDIPDNKARCVDLPDTGLCRASFSRWYYDPEDTKCMSFTYGGCSGNRNNFHNEDECNNFCHGITQKDVFGKNLGDRQLQEGSSGSVEVAIAVFLGICILVVLAVIGYCVLKKRKNRRQPTATISTAGDTEHLVYNRTTKPV